LNGIFASAILIAVAFLSLTVPWYHTTASQLIIQTEALTIHGTNSRVTTTSTNLTSYGTQTIFGQPQAVFTLQTNVTLNGECGSACWVSPSFQLQSGTTLQVTAPDCQSCLVAIDDKNGSYNAAILVLPPPHDGIGTYAATATVTDSGTYEVVLGNLGAYPIIVTTLSIAQIASSLQVSSETSELIQESTSFMTINSTAYLTTNATTYLQNVNAPYTIMGWAPLGAIVIIVAVIAAIAVLRQLGFKSAAEMGKLASKPDK
jgi:hypothetical protein